MVFPLLSRSTISNYQPFNLLIKNYPKNRIYQICIPLFCVVGTIGASIYICSCLKNKLIEYNKKQAQCLLKELKDILGFEWDNDSEKEKYQFLVNYLSPVKKELTDAYKLLRKMEAQNLTVLNLMFLKQFVNNISKLIKELSAYAKEFENLSNKELLDFNKLPASDTITYLHSHSHLLDNMEELVWGVISDRLNRKHPEHFKKCQQRLTMSKHLELIKNPKRALTKNEKTLIDLHYLLLNLLNIINDIASITYQDRLKFQATLNITQDSLLKSSLNALETLFNTVEGFDPTKFDKDFSERPNDESKFELIWSEQLNIIDDKDLQLLNHLGAHLDEIRKIHQNSLLQFKHSDS